MKLFFKICQGILESFNVNKKTLDDVLIKNTVKKYSYKTIYTKHTLNEIKLITPIMMFVIQSARFPNTINSTH